MSEPQLTLTALIETYALNVSKSTNQKNKHLTHPVELKVLLSDLCYVFFDNSNTTSIDRTYVVKFLQKNHLDYTHNTYLIISFLMKLIEYAKNMHGFNHKKSEGKLITIITDVIRAHISFATNDYYKDDLTGLYSFNYLAQIENKLQIGQALTVVMIDLDDLKKINDGHGHNYGNKVIKEFSKALLESIRQDDICIRFGGDEFLIIFCNEPTLSFSVFFERLEQNNRVQDLNVNYSKGFDTGLLGEKTLQDMIEAADFRMYQQKKANKLKMIKP